MRSPTDYVDAPAIVGMLVMGVIGVAGVLSATDDGLGVGLAAVTGIGGALSLGRRNSGPVANIERAENVQTPEDPK